MAWIRQIAVLWKEVGKFGISFFFYFGGTGLDQMWEMKKMQSLPPSLGCKMCPNLECIMSTVMVPECLLMGINFVVHAWNLAVKNKGEDPCINLGEVSEEDSLSINLWDKSVDEMASRLLSPLGQCLSSSAFKLECSLCLFWEWPVIGKRRY